MSTPLSTVDLPAIGIDVGFYSTKFTTGRDPAKDNAIQVDQFPSQAPRYHHAGSALPLAKALDGATVSVDGVPHFVGKEVFNVVEAHGAKAVVDDYSLSAAYKALFLGALAYIVKAHHFPAQLRIKRLVVGLPMSTVYSHSTKLRAAVEGAHTVPRMGDGAATCKVYVDAAVVVAQPQGALIHFGGRRAGRASNDTSLVLDMGGGTFDWFVSEGMRPNLPRCGAAPIGMLKCATVACDMLNPRYRNDPKILARVDEALRNSAEFVRITGKDHPMEQFGNAIGTVLNEALDQMLKSVGSLDNIDEILLTGGGARLLHTPLTTRLRDYAHTIQVDPEPVYSNVRGFHTLGEVFNSGRT